MCFGNEKVSTFLLNHTDEEFTQVFEKDHGSGKLNVN